MLGEKLQRPLHRQLRIRLAVAAAFVAAEAGAARPCRHGFPPSAARRGSPRRRSSGSRRPSRRNASAPGSSAFRPSSPQCRRRTSTTMRRTCWSCRTATRQRCRRSNTPRCRASCRRRCVRGFLDVGHHLGVVQLHAIAVALVDVLLGVAQLHTPLGPVEDRRRKQPRSPRPRNDRHMSRMWWLTPKIS